MNPRAVNCEGFYSLKWFYNTKRVTVCHMYIFCFSICHFPDGPPLPFQLHIVCSCLRVSRFEHWWQRSPQSDLRCLEINVRFGPQNPAGKGCSEHRLGCGEVDGGPNAMQSGRMSGCYYLSLVGFCLVFGNYPKIWNVSKRWAFKGLFDSPDGKFQAMKPVAWSRLLKVQCKITFRLSVQSILNMWIL